MKDKKMSADKLVVINTIYVIINVLITLIIGALSLVVALATLDCLLYDGIESELLISIVMLGYSIYNILKANIHLIRKVSKNKFDIIIKSADVLKYFIYCNKCSKALVLLTLALTILTGGGQAILIISIIYLVITRRLFRLNIEYIKKSKGEN